MADELYNFLRDRGIGEDQISHMMEQKIDMSTILLMEDDTMEKYIPIQGDRIATINFCKKKGASSKNHKRKNTLFEALKKKIRNRNSDSDESPSEEHGETGKGNKNAAKSTRHIEIGWLDYDIKKQQFKQVRGRSGGGTRVVSVCKDAKKSDLLTCAKSLFFPDGRSNKGDESCFTFDMRDFKEREFSSSVTIGELYESFHMRILRIYLCTTKNESDTDNELPEINLKPETSTPKRDTTATKRETTTPVSETTTPTRQRTSLIPLTIIKEPADDLGNVSVVIDKTELQEQTSNADDVSIIIITGDIDDEIYFNSVLAEDALFNADETDIFNPQEENENKTIIVIRMGLILKDMIAVFSDNSLMSKEVSIKRILPNGDIEIGDGSGVIRDCLSEFWKEFYDTHTVGANCKVPFLRHDFQCGSWEAVARIIIFGYRTTKYFPIRLALPMMEMAIYGHSFTELKDTFLNFISVPERQTLENALLDINSVDSDELLEVLDNHECKQIPRADQLNQIIREIAHKELIQEPKYVIDCMREVFVSVEPVFLEHEKLLCVYRCNEPTNNKVSKCLTFPEDMTVRQREVSRHLKRYVRELDHHDLSLFLRYCTGSDLFVVEQIIVIFKTFTEFTRRPIAHTCGSILELPEDYETYPDLRIEFNSILRSGIWVMDIV